jgi:hypothetical protein
MDLHRTLPGSWTSAQDEENLLAAACHKRDGELNPTKGSAVLA